MPETQQPEWFERTPVSPRLSVVTVVVFCLTIVCVPGGQLLIELAGPRPVQERELFRQFPTLESLQSFERGLERASVVAKAVRPYTQWAMTRSTRRGNEKVIVGRDGWMFYRPSVQHVVGPGFLGDGDPERIEGTPFDAILHFREQLAAQGIELVLLPMPSKETVCPEQLVAWDGVSAPENADTKRSLAELEERGVALLDPTAMLRRARTETEQPAYLPRDTHWTPTGMDLVAQELAAQIGRSVYVEGAARRDYRVERSALTNRGDLYDMLDLSDALSLWSATEVEIEAVVEAETGEPFEPDPQSPFLLLGDSFTNIYSDPQLHWGEHAGLAEHLALHLGIGIDVIALNDGGVNGCRQQLARRPGMLLGKRLVIWQFATRDFTIKAGKWKRIPIRSPRGA